MKGSAISTEIRKPSLIPFGEIIKTAATWQGGGEFLCRDAFRSGQRLERALIAVAGVADGIFCFPRLMFTHCLVKFRCRARERASHQGSNASSERRDPMNGGFK